MSSRTTNRVGEVLRRIVGRCISICLDAEVQKTAVNIQLCTGQTTGIKNAIHSLRREFENKKCEPILQIGANITNALILLNRTTAQEKIRRICHSLHIPLTNSYQTPSQCFVDKKSSYLAKVALKETTSHANVRDCNKASSPETADAKNRTKVVR